MATLGLHLYIDRKGEESFTIYADKKFKEFKFESFTLYYAKER